MGTGTSFPKDGGRSTVPGTAPQPKADHVPDAPFAEDETSHGCSMGENSNSSSASPVCVSNKQTFSSLQSPSRPTAAKPTSVEVNPPSTSVAQRRDATLKKTEKELKALFNRYHRGENIGASRVDFCKASAEENSEKCEKRDVRTSDEGEKSENGANTAKDHEKKSKDDLSKAFKATAAEYQGPVALKPDSPLDIKSGVSDSIPIEYPKGSNKQISGSVKTDNYGSKTNEKNTVSITTAPDSTLTSGAPSDNKFDFEGIPIALPSNFDKDSSKSKEVLPDSTEAPTSALNRPNTPGKEILKKLAPNSQTFSPKKTSSSYLSPIKPDNFKSPSVLEEVPDCEPSSLTLEDLLKKAPQKLKRENATLGSGHTDPASLLQVFSQKKSYINDTAKEVGRFVQRLESSPTEDDQPDKVEQETKCDKLLVKKSVLQLPPKIQKFLNPISRLDFDFCDLETRSLTAIRYLEDFVKQSDPPIKTSILRKLADDVLNLVPEFLDPSILGGGLPVPPELIRTGIKCCVLHAATKRTFLFPGRDRIVVGVSLFEFYRVQFAIAGLSRVTIKWTNKLELPPAQEKDESEVDIDTQEGVDIDTQGENKEIMQSRFQEAFSVSSSESSAALATSLEGSVALDGYEKLEHWLRKLKIVSAKMAEGYEYPSTSVLKAHVAVNILGFFPRGTKIMCTQLTAAEADVRKEPMVKIHVPNVIDGENCVSRFFKFIFVGMTRDAAATKVSISLLCEVVIPSERMWDFDMSAKPEYEVACCPVKDRSKKVRLTKAQKKQRRKAKEAAAATQEAATAQEESVRENPAPEPENEIPGPTPDNEIDLLEADMQEQFKKGDVTDHLIDVEELRADSRLRKEFLEFYQLKFPDVLRDDDMVKHTEALKYLHMKNRDLVYLQAVANELPEDETNKIKLMHPTVVLATLAICINRATDIHHVEDFLDIKSQLEIVRKMTAKELERFRISLECTKLGMNEKGEILYVVTTDRSDGPPPEFKRHSEGCSQIIAAAEVRYARMMGKDSVTDLFANWRKPGGLQAAKAEKIQKKEEEANFKAGKKNKPKAKAVAETAVPKPEKKEEAIEPKPDNEKITFGRPITLGYPHATDVEKDQIAEYVNKVGTAANTAIVTKKTGKLHCDRLEEASRDLEIPISLILDYLNSKHPRAEIYWQYLHNRMGFVDKFLIELKDHKNWMTGYGARKLREMGSSKAEMEILKSAKHMIETLAAGYVRPKKNPSKEAKDAAYIKAEKAIMAIVGPALLDAREILDKLPTTTSETAPGVTENTPASAAAVPQPPAPTDPQVSADAAQPIPAAAEPQPSASTAATTSSNDAVPDQSAPKKKKNRGKTKKSKKT